MGRDTIQLENAVSTISQEYLLEFTSEYGIPEGLHPELPGPEETIVEFPEGKVGVYTKFFEFANFRIPISQFLFDILGHYQIYLSQLSVIGAAKVSHFEINCRVLNIIPTLNLFRVFYIPSFNSGWMSFSKRPGKNTPQCYTKPLDSLKNWNNRFFWVDEKIFPTVVDWRTNAPKDGMPAANSYSAADVTILNTHHMDLFNFINAPNPTKVKTKTRPRAAHEVPLLTVTASRVIEMEDVVVASESSETPSTIEKSPLDFANEDPPQTITERGGTEDRVQDEVAYEIPSTGNASTTGVALETGLEEEVATMGALVNKGRRKRGNNKAEENAPPKVLRRDHDAFRPTQSTRRGKSQALMGLDTGSILSTPAAQDPSTATKSVIDPEPLSYAKPQPDPEQDMTQSSKEAATEIPTEKVATTEVNIQFSVRSPESGRSTSVPSVVGSPGGIYQPGWGVTNDCRLDTPDACQDMVDHIVPPGYFSELRHLPNADFLSQYNINLARQVAMGSQLRLRFEQEVRLLKNEQEVRLLKKAKAQIARRDQRIQAKNLEKNPLEAEIADLQLSNNQLSEQVSTLQTQVTGEEKIKAAFEEFKKYEDDKVEHRCAEMDARLDKLSVDFDEELYPHMLTVIAGRRWVIGHSLRLSVMKCAESSKIRQAFADVVSAGLAKGMSEGLKYGIEHGKAGRDLADIEAYDPEANSKLVKAFQDLKDLKYPMVDKLERLKDAPMQLIMASLHLESDTGEDAPQWICDLRPSSSQLKIPVYPEVRDPKDPWAVKEEVMLEDAIVANISRAEKKKKCRVVCRTHEIGSAHHVRSDGIPVSAPTVVPHGLVILLADAATQIKAADKEEEPHSRLQQSISLPPVNNL
ncbi:hypothetical protein Tco_1182401 [Tanacetum coccineum]